MGVRDTVGKIQLKSLDDMFGIQNKGAVLDTNTSGASSIKWIPLYDLYTFKSHPFKVKDDADMAALVESVSEKGILTPLLVRPRAEGGGYEIISGHRRKHAAELASLASVPAVIETLDDEEAAIRMVDANLQREKLLPSEKAKAFRIKLDAMKRQVGRPSKENVSQVGTQKRSDQILAEQVNESRNQIQRYIRLTYLLPLLLDMVDADQLKLIPAVEVSHLSEEQQKTLYNFMLRNKIKKISLDQAKMLRQFKDTLSDEDLTEIFDTAKNKASTKQKDTVTLNIPIDYIPKQHRQSQPDEELLRRIAKTINDYYAESIGKEVV